MKVALVQMQSSADLARNLAKMKGFVEEAKRKGAELVVFPEMAYFTGGKDLWLPQLSQFESCRATFQTWASHHSIALIPGTLREPAGSERYFNTLLCFDSSGKELARYRKIFLFKATLPDRVYDEAASCEAGHDIAIADLGGMRFGFSICFDLRFPELFRALKRRGAEAVILPSAFTVPTGQRHWEPLVKARAIENQLFLLAPGLTGVTGDNAKTYGHSLAISPWGEELIRLSGEEGMALCDLSRQAISEAAARVDAWNSRREDIFPITGR